MGNSPATELVKSADNFTDPISDEVRHFFQLINYTILCGIISFFGIGANVVNIVVFVRLGFKDSINISLMGLAISDLSCSFTMFWTSICHTFDNQNLDLPFHPLEFNYATGGWPHECFNRITSFITAFITLERCLCIAMPLKVKNIITPFRTKAINVSIFLSMFILFSPFYFVNKLEWKFDMTRNSSKLGIIYVQGREMVESITFFIHSVFLSSVLLICVAVCTFILVIKLNKKTRWRESAVAQTTSKIESGSVKEKKVIKMITLISTIFVICYIPPSVNFLIMIFCPDFSMSGMLYNLLIVTWSVTFVLEATNSSVNIFVYFNMSSKFKDTFLGVFYYKK